MVRYAGGRVVVERPSSGGATIWVGYVDGEDPRRTRAALFLDPGFVGLRVGRRYFKIRDLRRHPLRFSERNRHGYRPLLRVGEHWELGVK